MKKARHCISGNDRFGGRRHFLKTAGSLTAGAVLGRALPMADGAENRAADRPPQARKEVLPMQIGILMGTFARPTLEARFDACKANGLDCVQVSMDCAGLPSMPDRIDPEVADRIRREAAARGITIASLAGTFNMSHPEAEHRRGALPLLQPRGSQLTPRVRVVQRAADHGREHHAPVLLGVAPQIGAGHHAPVRRCVWTAHVLLCAMPDVRVGMRPSAVEASAARLNHWNPCAVTAL